MESGRIRKGGRRNKKKNVRKRYSGAGPEAAKNLGQALAHFLRVEEPVFLFFHPSMLRVRPSHNILPPPPSKEKYNSGENH